MVVLLKKEITGFFSSLTGFIVILVFLIANSLFLWVFPGEFNITENGYASIDSLFILAPWIFLFLVPAITMRSFAEEKRSGTIELLLIRPFTEFQIVAVKYLASLVLVLLSLIPTLIFFISVYYLGAPVGNIDTGGTWGSYIGLFFLASVYIAVGIFSSSLTDNQIIAFILSSVICFFLYIGFDSISSFGFLGQIDVFILNFSINEHYKSMSRGVIDSRDIVYFVSMVIVFIFFTKIILESRKWKYTSTTTA